VPHPECGSPLVVLNDGAHPQTARVVRLIDFPAAHRAGRVLAVAHVSQPLPGKPVHMPLPGGAIPALRYCFDSEHRQERILRRPVSGTWDQEGGGGGAEGRDDRRPARSDLQLQPQCGGGEAN